MGRRTQSGLGSEDHRQRWRTALAFFVMLAGVWWVYVPLAALSGDEKLVGLDYDSIHERRIRYAQQALFDPAGGHLPAWYTRELLGTPFWSNIQSFPFIPTRLIVLMLPPASVYAAAVALAATLSAAFAFAFARQVGLGATASAVTGWTFAAAGFFASRVMAGHLPLLEGYPALPLLLWLADRALRSSGTAGEEPSADGTRSGTKNAQPAGEVAPRALSRPPAWRLVALGLATTAVVLAGHPQLPGYAIVVALAYATIVFGRRSGWAWVVMALGGAVAAFALWPMAQLTWRSTRVLHLAASSNDIPLPYGRLLSYVMPWGDAWPDPVQRAGPIPTPVYPSTEYFWDTVCYVGWVPIAAAIGAVVIAFGTGWWRRAGLAGWRRPIPVVAALGLLFLVTSLPFVRELTSRLPGTFFRSPSRQVYVTGFALAVIAGLGTDWLLRRGGALAKAKRDARKAPAAGAMPARGWTVAVAVLLTFHVLDLRGHDTAFILLKRQPPEPTEQQWARFLAVEAAGQRQAMDLALTTPINRQVDDVGFFDSVLLVRPYRMMTALTDGDPKENIESLDGSILSAPALKFLGVDLVATTRVRPDLPTHAPPGPLNLYFVPDSDRRAAFVPLNRVQRASNESACADALRQIATGRAQPGPYPPLVICDGGNAPAPAAAEAPGVTPPGAAPDSATPAGATRSAAPAPSVVTSAPSPPEPSGTVAYERLGSDRIKLAVHAGESGYVRLLETFDPGWAATIDGAPVAIEPAFDALMAIAVPPGNHAIELHYTTPGATTGWVISVLAVAALSAVSWLAVRRSPATV